jgi:hypothetical protein
MTKLPLLGDASPWLHEAVSTLMATFSGEDASFLLVVNLLVELDKRAVSGDADAEKVLACVRQFERLVKLATRGGPV